MGLCGVYEVYVSVLVDVPFFLLFHVFCLLFTNALVCFNMVLCLLLWLFAFLAFCLLFFYFLFSTRCIKGMMRLISLRLV